MAQEADRRHVEARTAQRELQASVPRLKPDRADSSWRDTTEPARLRVRAQQVSLSSREALESRLSDLATSLEWLPWGQ